MVAARRPSFTRSGLPRVPARAVIVPQRSAMASSTGGIGPRKRGRSSDWNQDSRSPRRRPERSLAMLRMFSPSVRTLTSRSDSSFIGRQFKPALGEEPQEFFGDGALDAADMGT